MPDVPFRIGHWVGWRALLVLCLAIGGCTDGASEGPNQASVLLAEQLLQSTSESQSKFLEDLQVTREEYESAHQFFFECMSQKGWEGHPEVSPNGLTYDLTFTGQGTDTQEFNEDLTTCENEHVRDVAAVYQANLVAPAGQIEEVKDELMSCLEGLGITTADRDWSDGELADHLDEIGAPHQAWVCREVALARMGAAR